MIILHEQFGSDLEALQDTLTDDEWEYLIHQPKFIQAIGKQNILIVKETACDLLTDRNQLQLNLQ